MALSSHDLKRILEKHGFVLSRQRGSHQQFVGFTKGKKRRVTVIANQRSFAPGTLRSMIRQSGLSKDEFAV